MTIGYVLASLVMSTAVLSNQRTLVRRVPGIYGDATPDSSEP
jgi:hypothetical protein